MIILLCSILLHVDSDSCGAGLIVRRAVLISLLLLIVSHLISDLQLALLVS